MPGADWSASIVDAISGATAMVLIFSGHANESQQIKREVERAVAKGVRIVPFRIEDVALSRSLEYFISTPHWLDALAEPIDPQIARLAETLRLLEETRDSRGVPPPIRKHTGARLEDARVEEALRSPRREPLPLAPTWKPLKRPLTGVIAAAFALAAAYYVLVRKAAPRIDVVNFPPVVSAGGRDAVGTVQFTAGQDDVTEAQFQVVSAERFQPFSFKPPVAGQKHGSFSFSIHSTVPQQVTLAAMLVDAHGRRSEPVHFSFEVRKAAADRTIEIPVAPGFKLRLPH